MAYSFGQIEIYRRRDKGKKKKKKGYIKKIRSASKNVEFVPINHGFKGYQ
jgi:hypothetical protein